MSLAASASEGHNLKIENKTSGYIVGQRPRCPFRYDEKLETRMLSVIQHELGSNRAAYYDAAHPGVTVCRLKATLIFMGVRHVNGNSLLDPPDIFVDVDVCTKRILAVDRDSGIPEVTNDPPCA